MVECCNAPRPTLQTASMFFSLSLCVLLFVAFIIASSALHRHSLSSLFLKLAFVRSCRASPLSSLTVPRPTVFSVPSCQPTNLSRQPAIPSRASESCPVPDPVCCYRWIRIIPKHLQNIIVSYIDSSSVFFPAVRLRSEGPDTPKLTPSYK